MKTTVIFETFKNMVSENIICAYHGNFNFEIVNNLLISVKSDLNKPENDKIAAKKTYKVLVECLENIHKHANKLNEITDSIINEGIFILSKNAKSYSIKVGNLVHNNEVEKLTDSINEVNLMSAEQLKERYKEIITNGSISSRGGAGLGIVDIALKSGSKLNFSFQEYDNELKFFTLGVDIEFQN